MPTLLDGRFLTLCLIASSLLPLSSRAASFTPDTAHTDQALVDYLRRFEKRQAPEKGTFQYERWHFHYDPRVLQDSKTGRIIVDLEKIKTDIIPELATQGMHPDQIVIEADGGAQQGGRDIPVDLKILEQARPYFIYQGGPSNRQQYARVLLFEKGKLVHNTDNGFMLDETEHDKLNFPKIDPALFSGYPEPELNLPAYLPRAGGFNPGLVQLSGVIEHRNVVWAVARDTQNQALKDAFSRYGSDLHPLPVKDKKGQWVGWNIQIAGTHKTLHAGLHDILLKGGAAFSQHTFYWDDHFIAEARANNEPNIAIDTIDYWLGAQQPDGSIGRELDYKGTPYQQSVDVKFGKQYPNYEFFNPPLSGWSWHEVYRWNPARTTARLPRIIEMMKKQRQWFLKEHAAFDPDGKLVGFRWSNHGSGRDTAPRPIDELGVEALKRYGEKNAAADGREKRGLAVDLLAQYKMLVDHEREFLEILGRFDEAQKVQAESSQISDLLNNRYFNKKIGWYVDIVPAGKTDWKQTEIVNLAGFWPVAAKAASHEQVSRMIEQYLENPKKFGGPFLPCLPKDDPYYEEEGHYWRGGGWPPDWEMVQRALFETGFRAEAARLSENALAAMTAASDAYAIGDTPTFRNHWVDPKPSSFGEENYNRVRARVREYSQAFWSGKIHNSDAPGTPTVFEFYGLRRDAGGNAVPSYGTEIIDDRNGLHLTRAGFAGWGVLAPLRSAHYIDGLDAVPRFAGAPAELNRWLYALFTDPELSYHQLRHMPAFKPLADFIARSPQASFEQFQSEMGRQNSPNFQNQLRLLQAGYVELSPTFDPANQETRLSGYTYDGERFEVHVDHLGSGALQLTVQSSRALRFQFNQNWIATGHDSRASDEAVGSSPIFELGGDHPSMILPATGSP